MEVCEATASDGARIAYRVHGNSSTDLVLLHGWGASGRYFHDLLAHMDLESVRAIAIDLRGHGDSDKDGTVSWDRLAEDVLAVADHARADRFVAVGHSMGGKLAQYLAVVAPDRIAGLVLLASAPASSQPLPDLVASWPSLAGDGAALLEQTVSPFLRRPVPDRTLERVAADAARIPRATLEATLRLVADTSFADRLTSVRAPALVVAATEDAVHPAGWRDIVAASIPRARVEQVVAGSEMPIEAPAEVARLIAGFLEDVIES